LAGFELKVLQAAGAPVGSKPDPETDTDTPAGPKLRDRTIVDFTSKKAVAESAAVPVTRTEKWTP
jgi:hypothetical protein